MSLDRDAVIAALPAYDVGEELGRGATGIVLGATHRALGRDVAIKQLPIAFASDPKVRRRFIAEARLVASFDHRHVVRVYDFIEQDGLCLLVMERLGGGTVGRRSLDGTLDVREAVGLAIDACATLGYAHERNVLHRDIKPDNLMFGGDGTLKVTDFGIAKVIGGARTTMTAAGFTLGTPAYMAPEQASGGQLSPATDLYSLATVLYELLSGGLPYPETTDPIASLYQRVHEEPEPLRSCSPDIDDPLAAVVDRALQRDPSARPQDADRLSSELAAAASEVWGPRWSNRMAVEPSGSGLASRSATVGAVSAIDAPGGRGPRRTRAVRALAATTVAGALLAGAVVAATGDDDETPGTSSGSVDGFVVDSPSATIGAILAVTSGTPCPALPAGWTGPITAYVQLFDPRAVSPTHDGVLAASELPVDGDGSWIGELAVPAGAAPGEDLVRTSCFATGEHGKGPYFDYPSSVPLEITALEPAP